MVLLPMARSWTPPPVRRAVRRLRKLREHPWLSKDAIDMYVRARDASPRDLPPASPDEVVAQLCNASFSAGFADAGGQFVSATGCICPDIYHDPEVVTFLARVDPLVANLGGEERGLYRLAMKGVLPESLRTRQDKAMFEPAIARAALAGDGLATMRELSSLSALSSLGLVDVDRFRPEADACLAAVSRGMGGGADLMVYRWEPFWRTLAAEAFARQWGGASGPEGAAC
jgi:hypothetical protein